MPRTINASANADFNNIDELWLTGIDLGIQLYDIVVAAAITLPVSLLAFDAKETTKGIELNWNHRRDR
jgi:hypothetical protein